jgi:tetratricopeptide (TPR) repeat protein
MNPEKHDQEQQTTIEGDVTTDGGDFVGRDSHHHGDQIAGNKIQIDQAATVAAGDIYQDFSHSSHDYRVLIGLALLLFGVLVGAFIWYSRQTAPTALPPPVTVIVPAPQPPTPTTKVLAFAPATPEETLIIVPLYDNRSEGALPGVNPSSQIYDLVLKAALDHKEAKVRVEYYEQTIRSSEAAQSLGAQYKAKIVLWGWYNTLKVQPYVELVGDRTIQGEGVPIATPTPMAFYFLEEIPTQAAYLGLYMMGMAHMVVESPTELQRAIAFFSAALNAVVGGVKTNPWEAYVWRANCYFWLKEYEKALPDYAQAIRLNSADAPTYSNRGNVYASLGQREQAIQDYSEAIRLKPDYADAYFNRGVAYGGMGKYEQAIQDNSEAIRLNPDFASAYINRGVAYGGMGKYEQAIEDYSEAIRLKPDNASAYFNRGATYADMGKYEQAIQDYSEALRLKPDHADAYWGRGNAWGSMEKYEQAIEDYSEAIRLNPDYADVYSVRGNAWGRLEKYEQAIEDYSEAIRLNPDHANAYFSRAVAYTNLKQQELAIADLEKFLTISDDPYWRKEAERRLNELRNP